MTLYVTSLNFNVQFFIGKKPSRKHFAKNNTIFNSSYCNNYVNGEVLLIDNFGRFAVYAYLINTTFLLLYYSGAWTRKLQVIIVFKMIYLEVVLGY